MANLVVRIPRARSFSALQQFFTLLFAGALPLALEVDLEVDLKLCMMNSGFKHFRWMVQDLLRYQQL